MLYTYINNSEFVDIFFVISSEEEFKQMQDVDFMDTALVFLPPGVDRKIARFAHAVFKKLYGLDYVAKIERYDYALALDSEIDLLDLSDIHEICIRICAKKEIYGCQSDWPFANTINNRCQNFLARNFIDCSVIDRSIYFWWSQLPVYDLKIVGPFLNDIGMADLDGILGGLSWSCFENIIYLYYCVVSHGYKLVKLDDFDIILNNSLENNLSAEVMALLEQSGVYIYWQNARLPLKAYHKIIYHKDHHGGENRYNKITNDGLNIYPLTEKNTFAANNSLHCDLLNLNYFKNHGAFFSEPDFCLKNNIIFVAWLGREAVPEDLYDNFRRIRETCVDCHLLLLTPLNLDGFIISTEPIHSYFWAMPCPIQSELLKAYLMNHFGGAYVDASAPLDIDISRAMQDLLASPADVVSCGCEALPGQNLARRLDAQTAAAELDHGQSRVAAGHVVLARQATDFTKFWVKAQGRCLEEIEGDLAAAVGMAADGQYLIESAESKHDARYSSRCLNLEHELQACFSKAIENFPSFFMDGVPMRSGVVS